MDDKTFDAPMGETYRPTYEGLVRRYEDLLERYPDAEVVPEWRDHLNWYRSVLAGLDERVSA